MKLSYSNEEPWWSTIASNRGVFFPMGWVVVAVVCVVVISIPALLAVSLISTRLLFPFYYVVVLISTWWGGARSGLLATFLSVLVVDYFLLPPLGALSVSQADLEMISVFILVSLMITALGSARNRSEEVIRKAERKYRDIFENAVEGIFQTTLDGRFIAANPALARMLGFDSPEQLIRERADISLQHYVESQRREEFKRLLERHGVVHDFEYQAYRNDGRKIWIVDNVRAVRDEGGAVLYYEGTTQDITQRKRLKRALQESEERFRSFMNHMPGFAWTKNADGSYVYMNKRLVEVLPKHQDDWVGRTDADFWPPEMAAEYRSNDQRVLESGQELQAVETWVRDGQIRDVLASKFPIFDAQGNAIMVGGASIDITERKQAEQALRENQSHLQAILDYCPAMMFLKDLDGRYLQVNRELERTFNLTSEQVVGRTDAEVFPPELAAAFRASDRRVLEAGRSLESEEEAVYADGPHTYIVHKFPLRDAVGEVYAVGGISTDITARKRDEDRLRRQKELLQTIFDHIPLMISSFDENGRIKPVNRECERTLGWCREATPNRHPDIFAELYPDPQERKRGLDFIAAANGEWADFKTRAKDGRIIDTSWTVVRLSDGTRLGIGQDITERKRAEKALRASEERYRDLVENAHDIIYSHDLEGNYTSVNKAVEQITGYSREDALNINLAQIIAPEYLEQARSMIQRKPLSLTRWT